MSKLFVGKTLFSANATFTLGVFEKGEIMQCVSFFEGVKA